MAEHLRGILQGTIEFKEGQHILALAKEDCKIYFNSKNGAVALRNLHTIYCFASLKLTQYIVGFFLSATAPFF
ncbi:hypothetical protein CTM_24568, partial [Clostridium tetanomorphum DSM 665]